MGDFAAFLKSLFPPDPTVDADGVGDTSAPEGPATGQNRPTAGARPAAGRTGPPDTSCVCPMLPWAPDPATPDRPPVFMTGASGAEPVEPQRLTDSDESNWRTDWRENWRKTFADAGPNSLPEPWREWYEERAAIREYEGGQARDAAERGALAEVLAALTATEWRASVN